MYATVDIPEIEGIEALRIKMATSAGHVTGKKLVSSESATWLNEHFESNLADIKAAVDLFMLQGVNHIFFHGTSYSPPMEPWPGWLFYAAVHLNPRNSLWPHFSALNDYIKRTQSILQNSSIDNDVLLYYPIYDRFSTPGNEMIEHFDAVGAQFDGTAFRRAAEMMLAQGYSYDYISDKQLENTRFENGKLITEGNSNYKTIVVPQCKYIPHRTMKKIDGLMQEGATIIFFEGVPSSINGYRDVEENMSVLTALTASLKSHGSKTAHEVKIGKGRSIIGSDLSAVLQLASIRREAMADKDLQFLRKTYRENSTIYFIGNSEKPFEGWIKLQSAGNTAVVYDPMTGNIGAGKYRSSPDDGLEVWVQLRSRETLIVEVRTASSKGPVFPYADSLGTPLQVEGSWKVIFNEGGPVLPESETIDTLRSWTTISDAGKSFSGTATYSIKFQRPQEKATAWILDLGEVRESAEVILNGKSLGIFIGPVFQIRIESSLFRKENLLEIKVANLMANRISYLDRQQVFWKKFYNVNFPARKTENRKQGIFDASAWKPRPSGLLGPVQLVPIIR